MSKQKAAFTVDPIVIRIWKIQFALCVIVVLVVLRLVGGANLQAWIDTLIPNDYRWWLAGLFSGVGFLCVLSLLGFMPEADSGDGKSSEP